MELERIVENLEEGKMSRRQFLKVAAAAGVSSTLLGCLGQKPEEQKQELSKVLNVYNWSDYIAEDTIPNFEKEFSIKVNYDNYSSTDELRAKMEAGASGYDIIVPTDYMIPDFIRAGIVQPIDFANIPNFKNIGKKFKNPPYDPEGKFSVPYMWGTTGIGYNSEKVESVEGWEVMWDEKYKNRITMHHDMRELLGAGLKYLGYSNNSTSEKELKEARDILLKQKPLVKAYTSDTYIEMLSSGDAWLANGWSGDVYQAAAENENILYAIPSQGATLWVDNMCIPVGAPHKYAAEIFIDYILRPEVSAAISNYVWYANPNEASYPLTDTEIMNDTSIYPPEDVFAKLEIMAPLDAKTTELYSRMWNEIIGG
jgi:spermidine/putrescine transport system substrate-binding protein